VEAVASTEVSGAESGLGSRLAVLFVVGGVVLSIFDGFHTFSNTTAYTNPVVWRMAWWTPLLFGAAVAGGGGIYAVGYRRLGGPARHASTPRLALAFVLFAGLYAASGFWGAQSTTKLAALALGAFVAWLITDRSWQGVALALVSAAGGAAVESTLIALGTFRYLAPDVLGIPVWLPGLYLASGPVVGQIVRRVLDAPASFIRR
jgi:hypothetical protein